MEQVADRRDPLPLEHVRGGRALGAEADPACGELPVDRAHRAIEHEPPGSRLRRPEAFHVVGSTMRSMTSRRLGPVVLCVGLLAAACGSSPDRTDAARLPADPQALPEFTLADYQHVLEGLRGTPVVVNVWASWCGPCRKEAPLLASANRTYGDRVRFIGVDILDQRDAARDFMREYGWTYPSVYDPAGAIRDGLGLLGQPVTLFYDASGALVDTWSGPLSQQVLDDGLDAIAPADAQADEGSSNG